VATAETEAAGKPPEIKATLSTPPRSRVARRRRRIFILILLQDILEKRFNI
jgi:hypothetical protein